MALCIVVLLFSFFYLYHSIEDNQSSLSVGLQLNAGDCLSPNAGGSHTPGDCLSPNAGGSHTPGVCHTTQAEAGSPVADLAKPSRWPPRLAVAVLLRPWPQGHECVDSAASWRAPDPRLVGAAPAVV